MTKVQTRFTLQKALSEELLRRIADAHSIYGIYGITLAPSRDLLTVEYDATRLRVPEVEAALEQAGIAVELAK